MRRSMQRTAAIVVLVLVGAGCGDDDETPTATRDDPTTTTAAAPAEAAASGDGDAAGAAVTIQDFAFDPAEQEVEAGTAVAATNEDGVAHTWTADDGAWDSGSLATGERFEHVFDEAGTFSYRCTLHPAMTGAVTVA